MDVVHISLIETPPPALARERNDMRLTLAALALLASIAAANAGWTCSQYGNQTYCSDGHGNQTTCSRFGNQTYCN